ncbi:MAG: leucine-rich repeat domain-containing protein [Spirochaetia bacterium]|nr:leucine-rich repeat domain-containing protein [Spirochaetia bacterium]
MLLFAYKVGGTHIKDGILVSIDPCTVDLVIPDGVDVIGFGAARSLRMLETVVIPDSVIMIEKNAFYSCPYLRKVNLPDSLVSIGPWAFGFCFSLKEVKVPKNVNCLPEGVFAGCSSLRKVVLPKSLRSIHRSAFIDVKEAKFEGVTLDAEMLEKINYEDGWWDLKPIEKYE